MGFMIRNQLIKTWAKIKILDDERLAKQTPTPGVITEAALHYINDKNEMHLLNVYYPEGTSKALPTIVDIHGGGWLYGDKDLNRNFCTFLASLGFTVVCMSYRLLPETNLQGQVQDIFASLKWIETHGKEHHCDINRLFLTGDSAGGHLAGLITCVQLSPTLQKAYKVSPVNFTIQAVAICHGVCNANYDGYSKGISRIMINNELRRMMFGNKAKHALWYGKATFMETAEGLTLPPIMLVSCEMDPFSSQTISLENYLKSKKIPYHIKFYTKETGPTLEHVFQITHPEWPESIATNKEIAEFFLRKSISIV